MMKITGTNFVDHKINSVVPIYKSIKMVHFTVRLVSDKQIYLLSSKNEVLCDLIYISNQ